MSCRQPSNKNRGALARGAQSEAYATYFFGAGCGFCAGAGAGDGFWFWLGAGDGAGCTGTCTGAFAGGVTGLPAGAGFCVCSRTEPVEDITSAGARFTESVSDVIMNTMAHQVVARERNDAAPRGPKAVWLPAPPKAPARSAALPLCSMMTITSTKHTSTC